MKYLLSTGSSTTDPITYIKDIILLNMKLLPREIPYYKGGTNEFIQDIEEDKLLDNAKLIINDLLDRISLNFKNIEIGLDDLSLNQLTITAKIRIGSIIEVYEIA